MLLGALVGAGADLAVVQAAVDALGTEPVRLAAAQVTRAGLAATKVDVAAPDSNVRRTWPDVRALIEGAGLDTAVRDRALDVFARLARAEGAAHGIDPRPGALPRGRCAGLARRRRRHLRCPARPRRHGGPLHGRRRRAGHGAHRARPAPRARTCRPRRARRGRGAGRLRRRRRRGLHADGGCTARGGGEQLGRDADDAGAGDRHRSRRPRPRRAGRTCCAPCSASAPPSARTRTPSRRSSSRRTSTTSTRGSGRRCSQRCSRPARPTPG